MLSLSAQPLPALSPGHRACAGCGQVLAVRHALEAAGKDIVVVNATGCLEVTTTPWPQTAFGVPWIHSLFENAAAVASGILASLRHQGKQTKVIAQGGDGSTFDIGFGLISGMWERSEDILYICYDNEGYMNTGYQNSGATPLGASTSTAPAGKQIPGNLQTKKNLPKIALAHGVTYVATASVGDLMDLKRKVKRALELSGPKYIQILTPCIPGWKIATDSAIDIARLAVSSGLYPIFEAEDGKIIGGKRKAADTPPVENYLAPQKRFAHLFKSEFGQAVVQEIQKIADQNFAWLEAELDK